MAELSLLAKATLVLTAALVASRLARRAPASVRALLLASAFGVVLILPLATFAIPPRIVEIPLPAASESMLWVEPISIDVAGSITSDAPIVADRSNPFAVPSLAATVRVGWALGALLFVAPLIVALVRVHRLRRRGVPYVEAAALAAGIARETGVARDIDVFLHAELPTPMTCGLFRPAIGLPVDAQAWTEEERRHAIVHELEHVRRGDWCIHLVAHVACALYWFHPLAWTAWRRLRLESERACDDAVLQTAEQTAYAEQLVSLARRLSRRSPAPLLSMADRSNLSDRVTAVLDRDRKRGRAGIVATLAVLAPAIAIAVTISPLQAVTRLTEPSTDAVQAPQGKPLAFAAASIKRNTSRTSNQTIGRAGNTFVGRNVTLIDLVSEAYRIQARPLSGGPSWIDSERYDIEAKPEGDATWDEHLLMLQSLLADRFSLRIRREARNIPIYALVTTKNGVKLTAAADGDCLAPPRGFCGGFRTRPGGFVGRRVTLSQVAALLSSRSGRPVVDETKIGGFFDLELTWTPDPGQIPRGPAPDDAPTFDPSGPSLFTALEEQLGLRLQPTTGPVEHFVIEEAERPSPNDAPDA